MGAGKLILESLVIIIPMGVIFGGVMFFLPSRKSLNIYSLIISGLLMATFLVFLFGGGRNTSTTGAAVALASILIIITLVLVLLVPSYFGAKYRLSHKAKTLNLSEQLEK